MTNSIDNLHGLEGLQAALGQALEVLREWALEVLGDHALMGLVLQVLEGQVLWDQQGVALGDLPFFSLEPTKVSYLPSLK